MWHDFLDTPRAGINPGAGAGLFFSLQDFLDGLGGGLRGQGVGTFEIGAMIGGGGEERLGAEVGFWMKRARSRSTWRKCASVTGSASSVFSIASR